MSYSTTAPYRAGLLALTSIILIVIATGCASSYATPGRGAPMQLFAAEKDAMSDASVVKAISRRPLATLPAAVAIVRVQASGYTSATSDAWGHGAYSVVTQRDIQGEDRTLSQMQSGMPMLKAIVPISRLLLPEELHSDLELRQAAASLHADMVLIYTLDTSFQVEDVAAPLSVVTLGLSPNQFAHVNCTASAVLIDTRNGYVYGTAEATEQQDQLASAWTSGSAVDQTRRRVEAKAFKKLAGELGRTWTAVVAGLNAPKQVPPVGIDYSSTP
jgi:hypothetical protein